MRVRRDKIKRGLFDEVKAAAPFSGLPTNEEFQRTRVIDAAGTDLTLPMMRESFTNAWWLNWRPADIRASQPELLQEAIDVARAPGKTTWNKAEFVIDPQVPPGELWFCVREKPGLSTKIINIGTADEHPALAQANG